MARVNIEWSDVEKAREEAYIEHLRNKQQCHESNQEEQLTRIERKLDKLLQLLS